MPRVHFSVDKNTAKQLAREAEKRGLSLSRYLADLVSRSVPATWPAGYLESVVGSCKLEPLVEPDDLPLDDVNLGSGT